MSPRVRFLVIRLAQAVPVALGVTIIVFFMTHLLPGNPAEALLGQQATPARVQALTHSLGLDRPLAAQYFSYLGHLLTGNLGQSLMYQSSVAGLVGHALPASIFLIVYALVLSLVVSIPLATLAASRPGRVRDHGVRAFTMLAQGMPQFWIGIMLLMLVAVKVKIFPVGGYGTGFFGHLRYLFLPGFTLGLFLSPTIIRSLRASMISVLGADYVTTARSKGTIGLSLFRRHVLRNAAIPTVSIISVNLGYLIGSTLVVEHVFAVPGLGSLMVNAIFARDLPLIQGVSLAVALFVVVVGVLADLTYTLLDPRVKLDGKADAR